MVSSRLPPIVGGLDEVRIAIHLSRGEKDTPLFSGMRRRDDRTILTVLPMGPAPKKVEGVEHPNPRSNRISTRGPHI